MKAKLSITKDSNDKICLRIQDASSAIEIVRLSISLEDFAHCVTGLANVPADIERVCSSDDCSLVGSRRVTERVSCAKTRDSEQAGAVLEDFYKKYQPHGWALGNDGTDRQQPGAEHYYFIVRWEGVL